jgi:pilus assembly protein FimV
VAAALALAAPFALQAAGLGRLSVLSTLGAPLTAEIEIVALQGGEEDGLTARIASAEAFRQAGIEPSAALSTMRFAIVRRDGKPVIRITSSQPINEPFVDLLVELEARTGRLVREYTFLLDPPGYRGSQPIAATPAPAASAKPAAPLARPPEAPGATSRPVVRGELAPPPAAAAAAPARTDEPPAALVGGSNYEVRRGDTLGEIARANLPAGVSLNQMLIAIYRANQDAFIRENINLVRAGRILALPTAEEAGGVTVEDAGRLVRSHRAEWDEYRSRLAAQPAGMEAASGQRAVTGRIEAGVEPPRGGENQDQVRLAQADPSKAGASGARAARGDDAAARERALKEAQSRVTDLEKNVADLQKLLELKNQQLAELEKKAAGAKPAAEAPKPAAEAPKPAAEAPQPAAVPAPPVEAKKTQPAPEAKKAEPAKPKPKAVAPPPAPPPSLLDEFRDNQVTLIGVGVIVLILLAYGVWSWRRKKATQAKFSDSVLGPGGGTAPSLNEPGASESGGGASSQASVSQASGMEAEEVDPIAEADVYMAYGRDAQAEEILREALQKDPNRLPVHAKLLEIYAKRSDVKAFEQSALKVKSLTHGSGPDWDKAVALGRSIDPANGLYGGRGTAVPAAAAAPFAAAAIPAAAPTIDFDIGGASSPGMVATDIPLGDASRPVTPSTIDFDLGAGSSPVSAKVADPDATVAALDFDLNMGLEDTKQAPLAAAAPEPSGLDFDLNLDLGGDQPSAADKSIPSMDLSSISLDLGSAGEPGGSASSNDPKWQEVATKLDLAKAYEEMGDKDGARELLGEVIKDGDAAQKGQAQQILTKLG